MFFHPPSCIYEIKIWFCIASVSGMLIFPAVPEDTGMSRGMAAKNLIPDKIFAFLDLPVPGTKMEKSAPERRIPAKIFKEHKMMGKTTDVFKYLPGCLYLSRQRGTQFPSCPSPLGARARGQGDGNGTKNNPLKTILLTFHQKQGKIID